MADQTHLGADVLQDASRAAVPVSNARMYSVSVATSAAWQRLFAWVADHAGIALMPVRYEPPLLLSNLWERADLGAVMMCGLPFARRIAPLRILAQCVPNLPRYRRQATYCTDIVVAADSPFAMLADTFGSRAGYTLKDSQSGYYAFRHHLLTHHTDASAPYPTIVGGLMNARGIIDAITTGRIDVGPLDGYVHDLLRHTEPAYAAAVRTIATTEPTPMPAIVSTAALSDGAAARLRDAFQAAATTAELEDERRALLLAEFALPAADVFTPLADRARLVDDSPAWP